MELLEVSCESGRPCVAFLEARGAHRGHSKGSHSPCAKYHTEEKTGAMMSTNPLRDSKVKHCAHVDIICGQMRRASPTVSPMRIILFNVNDTDRRGSLEAWLCVLVY